MKISIAFYPSKSPDHRSWPSPLNNSRIETGDGILPIPSVGDIVLFNLGEGETPQRREVIRRVLEYSPDECLVACETDPAKDEESYEFKLQQ